MLIFFSLIILATFLRNTILYPLNKFGIFVKKKNNNQLTAVDSQTMQGLWELVSCTVQNLGIIYSQPSYYHFLHVWDSESSQPLMMQYRRVYHWKSTPTSGPAWIKSSVVQGSPGYIDSRHPWMWLYKVDVTIQQGGLACCSPWGHIESDTVGWLNNSNNHTTPV